MGEGVKEGTVRTSFIESVGVIDEVRLYRGEKILSIASSLASGKIPDELTPELAIDVFYSLYLPLPALSREALESASDESDRFRAMVAMSLLSSSNLWRVKPFTVADSTTSLVAAASFIEKLARQLRRSSARPSSGSQGRDSRDEREGGQGRPGDMDEEAMKEAVEKALETVERDAKVAKDIKQLVAKTGIGKTSTLAFDESIIEDILRLARETDVSRILDNVRGLRLPSSSSKLEERHVKGWIEGLEYGRDVERIHYSQLALPEEYFYVEYANDRLLLYRKVLPANRGPIYLLLDKSGSMVGSKIDWARAVAVALFKKAVDEGRMFFARFFDSIAYTPFSIKPSNRASDVIKLLAYLASVKAGGGTDITRAIAAAVSDIKEINKGSKKVCDIVLITDGEDRLSADNIEKMLKSVDARLHTVVVQGHNPYLQSASYRYFSVKKLSDKEALQITDFT